MKRKKYWTQTQKRKKRERMNSKLSVRRRRKKIVMYHTKNKEDTKLSEGKRMNIFTIFV